MSIVVKIFCSLSDLVCTSLAFSVSLLVFVIIFIFVISMFWFFFFFFFFQADDGIPDVGVTGVQTCALPICARRAEGAALVGGHLLRHHADQRVPAHRGDQRQAEPGVARGGLDQRRAGREHAAPLGVVRSEERRGGQGWSTWGSPRT